MKTIWASSSLGIAHVGILILASNPLHITVEFARSHLPVVELVIAVIVSEKHIYTRAQILGKWRVRDFVSATVSRLTPVEELFFLAL